MDSPGFAAIQREFNARMGLGRLKGKDHLFKNKEDGFNISSFQAELVC